MTLKDALVRMNEIKQLRGFTAENVKAMKLVTDYAQTKYLLDIMTTESIGQVATPQLRKFDHSTPHEFYCHHECNLCHTPITEGDCFCRHCGTVISWGG